MRERENLLDDFFSFMMRPLLDVPSYRECILGGVQFHTIERDFQWSTQNSRVMVIGENSGSEDVNNNFYDVWDEALFI